ncbi:MAG: MFS transporter [bacterium]|nr:MFS transporter [bacterium]
MAPLGERNYRLFFIGFSASVIGSGMAPVVFTFGVLDEGFGVGGVSVVLAAETIPLVVLLLLGGVVADRFPRKLSMLSSEAVRFFSQGALAVLLLTGHPPLWVFVAAAVVDGAGDAFFKPALIGLIPELVPRERLQQANALRGLPFAVGQVAGPGVAGVIVAAGGPGWAIAIDAATYLFSALFFSTLRIPRSMLNASASMFRELLDGWREFRSRTWLWLIVMYLTTFDALSYAPFMVVGAVVTQQHLGGAASWGLFNAMFGVGSIVGGLVAAHVRSTRPLVTATVSLSTFAIPLALIAVLTPAWVIAVGAGVAGVGKSIFGTVWETTMQRQVPGEVLSRLSAYPRLGSGAFMPIGFLIADPLAETIGTRQTLILAAAWVALSSVAVLAAPSVRNLRLSGASA